MKIAIAISGLLLFVAFSFGSRTQPQKIEGKDGDAYIMPGHDVVADELPKSIDIIEEMLNTEIVLSVMKRRFIDEFPEFKDREEMERDNDEN